jgi:hypothetical protein
MVVREGQPMSATDRRVLELMTDGEHDTFSEAELRRFVERDAAIDTLLRSEPAAGGRDQPDPATTNTPGSTQEHSASTS